MSVTLLASVKRLGFDDFDFSFLYTVYSWTKSYFQAMAKKERNVTLRHGAGAHVKDGHKDPRKSAEVKDVELPASSKEKNNKKSAALF